jgi:hypothetical protein
MWKVLQPCQDRAPMRYVPLPSQFFKTLFLFLQKIREPLAESLIFPVSKCKSIMTRSKKNIFGPFCPK